MRCKHGMIAALQLGRAVTTLLLSSALPLRAQQPTMTSTTEADPFARYTTPGQCEQAAIRLRQQYWRTKREDTVRYAPATDSEPAMVVAAARLCARRFAVATVPARELLNLTQLYLWAQQPALADTAIQRLVRTSRSPSSAERGWTLHLLTTSLLNARPTPLALIRSSLQSLDMLGDSAAIWRAMAHTAVAQYALSLNNQSAAEQEGHAAVSAIFHSLNADRLDWRPAVFAAYRALAQATALRAITLHGDPGAGRIAVLSLFDSAASTLNGVYGAGSADRQQLRKAFAYEGRPYQLLGADTLPAIRDAAWYGSNDKMSQPVSRPRRGTVTLLVFVDTDCENGCYPMYATLRRLAAKYGTPKDASNTAADFEIILLASTHGYFRRILTPVPKIEADSAGSYFVHFLKLPAVVAVETTSFFYIADGRRRNTETANHRAYFRERDAVLVDRYGIARWVGNLLPQTETVWEVIIAQALRSEAQAR